MDCILGYYLNPLRSGVAKFNALLAQHLGVPVHHVFDPLALTYQSPLLSFKGSELSAEEMARLERLIDEGLGDFSVFLHTFSDLALEKHLIARARRVYCGNAELVARLQPLRADVVEAWCPGTLLSTQRFNHAELSVFSFGMAHKIRARHYRRLHTLLEQTGQPYCLYLSTALHESTSFEESFGAEFDSLKTIFGDRVYFLGYLSDNAVYNYLLDTTFFAAFFEKGVRANNTTVNIAMQLGSVVITNLDRHSPAAFRHGENILDIHQLERLPLEADVLARLSARSRETSQMLGWEALVAAMREQGQPS